MWPASALLTGNGVAFVLRVPGTEHGDWWSMNGWWIFAGTSAIALLSKYLIRFADGTSSTRRTSGSCSASCSSARSARIRSPSGGGRCPPRSSFALVLIVAGGFLILAAAAPRRDRRRVLARVRRGHRRARRERPHDDGRLARRPDRGRGVLVAPRLLAGDPRLPLLHDHRPEDDPARAARAPRLRGRRRSARDPADRAADDRVRHEGRDPRRTLRRLRRAAVLLALVGVGAPRETRRAASDARESSAGAASDGSGRVRRPRRRGRHPGAAGRRIGGVAATAEVGAAPRDHDRRLATASRAIDGADRADDRTRRRSPTFAHEAEALRRAISTRAPTARERRVARVAVGADRGRDGRADRGPDLRRRRAWSSACAEARARDRRRSSPTLEGTVVARPTAQGARQLVAPRRAGVVPPHARARPRGQRYRIVRSTGGVHGAGRAAVPRPAPADARRHALRRRRVAGRSDFRHGAFRFGDVARTRRR